MSRNPPSTFEFTIDRSKWACKTNNELRGRTSYLRDSDGFKCCLGFMAEAMGLTIRTGLDQTMSDLEQGNAPVPANLRHDTADAPVYDLYEANDTIDDNGRREKKLTRLFSEVGMTVNFTGEYLKEKS